MKKVLLFATLFLLASISAAFAQTWFYTKPNGQPGGTATYSGPMPYQQYQTPDATAPYRMFQQQQFDLNKANREIQEQRLRELEIQRQERELGIERPAQWHLFPRYGSHWY